MSSWIGMGWNEVKTMTTNIEKIECTVLKCEEKIYQSVEINVFHWGFFFRLRHLYLNGWNLKSVKWDVREFFRFFFWVIWTTGDLSTLNSDTETDCCNMFSSHIFVLLGYTPLQIVPSMCDEIKTEKMWLVKISMLKIKVTRIQTERESTKIWSERGGSESERLKGCRHFPKH